MSQSYHDNEYLYIIHSTSCMTMQVFCSAFGVSIGATELDGVHAWIAIIIIPIVLFCWIRNLESLSSFSLVANLCIAVSLGVLFYEEIYSFM